MLASELPWLEAIALAARAHQGQLRKDRRTPYVSHVFRVCLIVRHVFGLEDERALMAALLHDTIEDTRTDFDDLLELLRADGHPVADWVAALSKDKRREEHDREAAYLAALADAPWQVKLCKLADLFDNLIDSKHLTTPEQREQTRKRVRQYLDALAVDLPAEARAAYATVVRLFAECLPASASRFLPPC